jgi:hypothetical protein
LNRRKSLPKVAAGFLLASIICVLAFIEFRSEKGENFDGDCCWLAVSYRNKTSGKRNFKRFQSQFSKEVQLEIDLLVVQELNRKSFVWSWIDNFALDRFSLLLLAFFLVIFKHSNSFPA